MRDSRPESILYRVGFVQNFLPDVIGPVRSDWCDEKGLKFDIAKDEGAVHAD